MLDRNSTGTPIAGAAALVTGANRGFGRAVVDELIDRGAARVYATARSQQTPRDKRIVPLSFDVAAAARAASDVSIVVNNARISLNTPVLDVPLPDIRAELETNLFGTIRVARAFSPDCRERRASVVAQPSRALASSTGASPICPGVWAEPGSCQIALT